jgi:hypothetical protein
VVLSSVVVLYPVTPVGFACAHIVVAGAITSTSAIAQKSDWITSVSVWEEPVAATDAPSLLPQPDAVDSLPTHREVAVAPHPVFDPDPSPTKAKIWLELEEAVIEAEALPLLPKAVAVTPNGATKSAPVNDTDPPDSDTGVPPVAVKTIAWAPEEMFGNPNTRMNPPLELSAWTIAVSAVIDTPSHVAVTDSPTSAEDPNATPATSATPEPTAVCV